MKILYKSLHILSLIFLVVLGDSCQEDLASEFESKGVIEGKFRNGGYAEVLFSRSIIPEQEGELSEMVLNWAKVILSDGEHEIVLTGEPIKNRIPPYRYFSDEMEGEPGKTYKIKADFGKYHVESECRMPFPTKIENIGLKAISGDSIWTVTLNFFAPEDVPAYYYLSIRERKRGSHDRPCMLGCIQATVPGELYSISILKPKNRVLNVDFELSFKSGEEWIVSLNRIEKQVYEFWSAYDNMLMFSSSPFISSEESLPTNITGGLGIWSVEGSDSQVLIIP